MAVIEGVDFSAHEPGKPGSAALKAAGKRFVCTYLGRASDWRVMTPGEVAELLANGVDVVANYEGTADRFLAGYEAGRDDAVYAQEHLVRLGLPPTQPIYFSCDFDATPGQQIVVDAYLRGAASVIGTERTGVYGGYWVVKRCKENGTARWFWQTSAWSGGQWHPACHLQQYAYGHVINGVECDDTRAVQPHYGQASDFRGTRPGPVYAKPVPPVLKDGEPFPHKDKDGIIWLPLAQRRWTALRGTPRKQRARDAAPDVGKPVRKGERATFAYHVAMPDGSVWFVSRAGSRCRADAFVPAG